MADDLPRYSSGYRLGGVGNIHEFWHYCADDVETRWPDTLSMEKLLLDKFIFSAKLRMIDFLRGKMVTQKPQMLAPDLNPENFLARIRFIHYKASDSVRFIPHKDKGAVTMFVFQSSPGLEIQDEAGEWKCVSDIGGPLMGVSSWTEDTFHIPALLHRVKSGNSDRYSAAIFLHHRLYA
jgi:hypothetical protein